ncbi:ABC transporter substrate-binding protein [[Eubacterium] cellulosolvens]
MAGTVEPKSRRKEFTYRVSEEPSESTAITRRQALGKAGKAAVGAAVIVAGGAALWYYSTLPAAPPPTPTPTPTTTAPVTTTRVTTPATTPLAGQSLKWLGPSFMIDDELVGAYEDETGVNIEETVTDLDTIRSRMLTGGAQDFDECGADSAIWLALKPANVTKRFPPGVIPRWKPEDVYDLWMKPDTTIGTAVPPPLGPSGPYIAKSVIWPHVWAETPGASSPEDDYGQKDQMFHIAPLCWNYDAVLFNPKYAPDEAKKAEKGTVRTSWEMMYNRKYVGRSAILDSVATVTNHVAAYLIVNKMMSVPEVGANDLKRDEMDEVIDFLIEQKKAGQFRVTWGDFMQLVNLYLTEEIWVSDAWQPVEYPVRAGGTPCYYIEPVEGYRNWLDGNAPTAGTTKDALVYNHINWQYGPWYAINILKNGYHTPIFPGKEIRDAFGAERYGWVYEGKPTYDSFTPEEQPLFAPQKYKWHMEPGTPDETTGNYKDGGSIERRTSLVAVWGRVPHDLQYYFEAWSRFRAA